MPEKPQVEPYDFVPLVGTPDRRTPVGHDRYSPGRHSGILVCRLTAKTPLFVYDPRFSRSDQGHETASFPVHNGVAAIPGTSLKGVIRSVAEAVEPSCMILPAPFPPKYQGSGITRDREVAVRLPPGFERCQGEEGDAGQIRPRALCPACRLFGSLDPKGRWAYAGRVAISDARSGKGEYALLPHITLDVLSTPKPEARPHAYTLAGGTIRGRKFYRHRYPPGVLERAPDRSGRPRRDHQNKTVQPVKEGSQFHFTVEYGDLDDGELRLLLYALVLEDGLWHKIGLGKPIGLGSAHIEIREWTRIDRAARYRALGGGVEAPLVGDVLAATLAEWVRPYRESQSEPLRKVREIFRPDPTVEVRYIVERPV